jgi:hypothetical protein
MARGILLVLGAAALLGGCAAPVEQPGGPGGRWGLSGNPTEGAKLALAVPGADDVRLTMTCRPRSGIVDIMVVTPRNDGAVVELHSGKIWNRYPGAGSADQEIPGAMDLDLKLAAIDPVLAHLADTGELALVLAGRGVALPNAFAPAHDFMAICRQPR